MGIDKHLESSTIDTIIIDSKQQISACVNRTLRNTLYHDMLSGEESWFEILSEIKR